MGAETLGLDPDCPFCGIVRHESKADIVAEDERAIAFLDLTPSAHGHTLVAPKVHVPYFPDLPAEYVGPLFGLVQQVSRAAMEAVGSQGVMVLVNTVVGQTVPHAHVHVVPRWKGDALEGCMSTHVSEIPEERQRIAERIRSAEAVGSVPT